MECHSCFATTNLYRCTHVDCPHSNKFLCLSCGHTVHRHIKDHGFAAKALRCNKADVGDAALNAAAKQAPSELSEEAKCEQSEKHWSVALPQVSPESTHNAVLQIGSAVASTNVLVAGVSVGVNAVVLSQQYSNNQIVDENGKKDPKEYHRLLAKSTSVPVSSFLCGAAAKLVAASVFAAHGPGAWIVVWLAAVGYGILGSCLSQKAFEKYLPAEKERRKELKRTAVRVFGFFEEDVENKALFNKKHIERKYRRLAKQYHPDAPHGDVQKFQELEIYRRIVLAMLDDESVFPMIHFDLHGKPYIDQTEEVPKPIAYRQDACV